MGLRGRHPADAPSQRAPPRPRRRLRHLRRLPGFILFARQNPEYARALNIVLEAHAAGVSFCFLLIRTAESLGGKSAENAHDNVQQLGRVAVAAVEVV